MKQWLKTNRGRLHALGILLLCLVLLSVILLNSLVGKLAKRYSWYSYLTASPDYGVSEECYALLDRSLGADARPVTILFLRDRDTIYADRNLRYILETAESLAARYEKITVLFADLVESPDALRKYSFVKDARTGKTALDEAGNPKTRALYESSVILSSGDYYRVYDIEEFFSFEDGDLSKVYAYAGEVKLAAGLLHAQRDDAPLALLTNNHGETFYDYELIYLLDDAGYAVDYIDLSKEEIPASCNLILTYNPNTDFLDSDGNRASETDCLKDFLSTPGNHFLLFAESGTPRLASLESFLLQYGVSFSYSASSEDPDKTYRYSVKDDSMTLTSDGYTIYGLAKSSLLDGVKGGAVFKNATEIRVASGFVNRGNGRYEKANMTLSALYTSGERAEAFAGGKQVGAGESILATLTEVDLGSGSSFVSVFASTSFGEGAYLQSAVYANRDVLLRLCSLFGAGETPEGLTVKPFSSDRMSLVTIREKLLWTVGLVSLPILVCGILAPVILIRRKNKIEPSDRKES
ncbi:MAG: hypothetical protein IJR88_06650 [Clostridia bacterium]|nr:hypothetical protein [Clostridia bacterium]